MNTSWGEFCYSLIETGWFDHEDRPKTSAAMRTLWERMPQGAYDQVCGSIVFAPSPWKLGEVLPTAPPSDRFVYLAPQLESKPQEEVDFIVAHEFAHIVLKCFAPDYSGHRAGPNVPHEEVPGEKAADELATAWGFQKRVAIAL